MVSGCHKHWSEARGVVALDALHMHGAVPPGAQDLRYPLRVVPIGLVAHRGKDGLHVPGLQHNRLEARRPKPIGQPLGQAAGFQTDAGVAVRRRPSLA